MAYHIERKKFGRVIPETNYKKLIPNSLYGAVQKFERQRVKFVELNYGVQVQMNQWGVKR